MTFESRSNPDRTSSYDNGTLHRPLHIAFDTYTEGDQEYKKELGLALMDNLVEFRESLTDSIEQNNPRLFLDACHKGKVTLSMLADKELDKVVDELQKDIVNQNRDTSFIERSRQFRQLCDSIMVSLKKEITGE